MILLWRHTKAANLVLFACFSAGCAVSPSECDPRTGDVSFYVKARCFYSDEYKHREEQKRAILEEELRLKELFEETYAVLKSEQEKLSNATETQRGDLTELSQSVTTLHDALQAKAKDDVRLKQQISTIRVEAEKIQQQPGQSPVQQRQAISDLMVKVSDLQKAMELR